MCARYLIAIWKKDYSIRLWILELEICKSWRSLTIVVSIVLLIRVMIIMAVVQSTLVGIEVGGEGVLIKFLVGGLCKESIVAVSEFNYLYFEVWVGCEWCFLGRWGS